MKEEELLSQILKQMGSYLAELRRKSGYTSYENFAYDHEIPRMQYWRIEKGRVNITMKSLLKILAIHKISLSEFFVAMEKKKT